VLVIKFYSHIIWDWNGTLFNDVEWCVCVIDTLLLKRGLKPLGNVADYQAVFGFPIINYYERAGFNFTNEPFEVAAKEYIDLYHTNKSGGCELHKSARFLLEWFCGQGKVQTILSASEKCNLIAQISEFGIEGYFEELLGLGDIYAKSKAEIGADYIRRRNVEKAVLIGDTEHDFEVATALGIDCLLVANGHQSKEKLMKCGVPVLDDIIEVVKYIC